MQFEGYYKLSRLKFLNKEFWKNDFIVYKGEATLRKTASFYGKNINFYIDTSDGVNEDLKQNEYCGRIMRIIAECQGKPFIVFKTSYSPIFSKDIIDLAERNNGKVLPFFIMSYYDNFYEVFLNRLDGLIKKNKETPKTIDTGFYANLTPYIHPKPQTKDNRLSWREYRIFGLGVDEFTENYIIYTRQNIFRKLHESNFSFAHKERADYDEYLRDSMAWKVCISPAGCGEYTPRMLEHAAMGQCVVSRKNTYDNAISYKGWWPEVDFEADDWQEQLQEIIYNREYWADRCFQYYYDVYQPEKMVNYLKNEIKKYESVCL